MYSPDIPDSSADFTLYLPRYWNSLSHGLISLGRMQRIFAVEAIHSFVFSFHQVPITAGWPEAMWIQILYKDFIHDWCAGNRTPDLSLSGPTLYHSAMQSILTTCQFNILLEPCYQIINDTQTDN